MQEVDLTHNRCLPFIWHNDLLYLLHTSQSGARQRKDQTGRQAGNASPTRKLDMGLPVQPIPSSCAERLDLFDLTGTYSDSTAIVSVEGSGINGRRRTWSVVTKP